MILYRAALVAFLAAPTLLRAQSPLRYTLRVDSADLTSVAVELRIPAVPDTLRLGMATHDEYDDRYWRYVRDLRAESGGAPLTVMREDSSLWRVTGARSDAGDVIVRYRIALPPESLGRNHLAWKPYLGATGGFVGGIDCFLFLPDRMNTAAIVTLELPKGWRVATGLEPAGDAHTFRATDAATLLDSPILVGRIREWRTTNATLAFLDAPSTVPFDTMAFVHVVAAITDQAVTIFGGAPDRRYTFLFLDDAGLALEHVNSLVLGVSSANLAHDSAYYAAELAHEFFHTWNLIRLHPAGLRAPRTGETPRVPDLWFSEGITIYFSDELLLRAGLYPSGQTRATRLASRITRYLTNPGYTHISPQRASLTVGLPPGINGDYSGDYYLSGQLAGDLLDLIIRDSTKGARGMDQVMTALYRNSAGEPGYTLADIERAANSVCGCDLTPFFERHIANSVPIDFDGPLRTIGYKMSLTWDGAHDSTGAPLPDTRVFVARPDSAPPDSPLRIGIIRPTGAWAAAGLHSGDELLAIDGKPVTTVADFRQLLRTFKVGQHVKISYQRKGKRAVADVMIDVYVLPHVTLEPLPDATPEQLARRARWLAGER